MKRNLLTMPLICAISATFLIACGSNNENISGESSFIAESTTYISFSESATTQTNGETTATISPSSVTNITDSTTVPSSETSTTQADTTQANTTKRNNRLYTIQLQLLRR